MSAEDLPPAAWAAVLAIKEGLTPFEATNYYRQAGGKIDIGEMGRLMGEAEASLGRQIGEIGADPRMVPMGPEITDYTTATASGYVQMVHVGIYNPDTFQVEWRPYTRMAKDVIAREDVIDEALDMYKDAEDDYGDMVLGAIYTWTGQAIPSR